MAHHYRTTGISVFLVLVVAIGPISTAPIEREPTISQTSSETAAVSNSSSLIQSNSTSGDDHDDDPLLEAILIEAESTDEEVVEIAITTKEAEFGGAVTPPTDAPKTGGAAVFLPAKPAGFAKPGNLMAVLLPAKVGKSGAAVAQPAVVAKPGNLMAVLQPAKDGSGSAVVQPAAVVSTGNIKAAPLPAKVESSTNPASTSEKNIDDEGGSGSRAKPAFVYVLIQLCMMLLHYVRFL